MNLLFKISHWALMLFIVVAVIGLAWSIQNLIRYIVFDTRFNFYSVGTLCVGGVLALISLVTNVYAARGEKKELLKKNWLPDYNAPGPPPKPRVQTYKVKIIKCSNPESYWYHNRIGETFECTLQENNSMFWPTMMIYKTVELIQGDVQVLPPQRSNLLPCDVDVLFSSTSPG